VEIFRGTPMMVQALVIFWGFALLNNGRTLNVIFSGLLIVSVKTGAYMAEIVRGKNHQSLHHQRSAAKNFHVSV